MPTLMSTRTLTVTNMAGETYVTKSQVPSWENWSSRTYPCVVTVEDSSGWRPPTAYFRTLYEGQLSSVNLLVDWQIKFRFYKPYIIKATGPQAHGVSYTVPSMPVRLVTQAETKALLKLKSRGGFNAAVAFGERRETYDLVTKHITTLTRFVRQVRKGDLHGASRTIGIRSYNPKKSGATSANAWLELQYGWLPLLSDCHNAVNMLHENDLHREDNYRVAVVATAKEAIYTQNDVTLGVDNMQLPVRVLTQGDHKVKVRLDYRLENPNVATQSQLGITNPLEVAWELLPFSFIADWFLPIGDYISTFDAALGWAFVGGSKSLTTKYNRSCFLWKKAYAIGFNSGEEYKRGDGLISGGRGRAVNFTRSVYSSSPIPQLPSFDMGGLTHGTRALNALALLRAAFK